MIVSLDGITVVTASLMRHSLILLEMMSWLTNGRAASWIKTISESKSLDKDLDAAYDEVGYELIDIFGDIYGAFETAADEGSESLINEGITKEWAEAITEVAKKNITPPEVHISGYVDIQTYSPNGVEIIKEALLAAEDNGKNSEHSVKVQCVGAPRYRITVTSYDYILAEKELQKAAKRAIKIIEESNGNGEFLRELE